MKFLHNNRRCSELFTLSFGQMIEVKIRYLKWHFLSVKPHTSLSFVPCCLTPFHSTYKFANFRQVYNYSSHSKSNLISWLYFQVGSYSYDMTKMIFRVSKLTFIQVRNLSCFIQYPHIFYFHLVVCDLGLNWDKYLSYSF